MRIQRDLANLLKLMLEWLKDWMGCNQLARFGGECLIELEKYQLMRSVEQFLLMLDPYKLQELQQQLIILRYKKLQKLLGLVTNMSLILRMLGFAQIRGIQRIFWGFRSSKKLVLDFQPIMKGLCKF
jgi:hypothetical protein